MKLAINGLGRIGRLVFRRLAAEPELEIVAANDLAEPKVLAHLLRHDTVHGRAACDIHLDGAFLVVAGQHIPLFREADPAALPFGHLGAQVVLDCTGQGDGQRVRAHLRGSVGRVILGAPSPEADRTVILGVNEGALDLARDRVLSCGGCTANALAPVVKVLDDSFGLDYGLVTTVHSYTNDQRILDLPHADLRRARAAALSMIPTTTDAPEAIDLALPHLQGRVDGLAVRVPTPDVSLLDLCALLKRTVDVKAVNAAFAAAAAGPLKGLLEVLEEELVSSDLVDSPASALVDPFLTRVMAGRMVKVFAWYDNEFAYAARMVDLVRLLARREAA